MGNTLGAYDQIYYAQEALSVLYQQLGMARRVYRRLDPQADRIHQVVTFRRPMTFTATSMPAAATDFLPDTVNLTMSHWDGTVVTLTDKELSYGKEAIFAEHVAPMANSVARAIDASLQALYVAVPWQTAATSSLAVADIVALRQILLTNGAPLDANLHLQLSPTLEAEALANSAFAQWTGSGAAGAETQVTGSLGTRYGFETYCAPTVPTHTAGSCTDAAGALTAEGTKGASSIAVGSLESSGTLAVGDTLVIAGNRQKYAVSEAVTMSGGANTIKLTPNLVQTYNSGSVVTVTQDSGETSMAFHRDAFALVMGALPAPTGQGSNAEIYTAADASSGLSIRVRRWYDPNNAAHKLSVDALWGVTTLNGNLAVRLVD